MKNHFRKPSMEESLEYAALIVENYMSQFPCGGRELE
jgi:hypothetical protein